MAEVVGPGARARACRVGDEPRIGSSTPAALGRDTATLGELGYALFGLRAFDAFPMTHHVECVATFEPEGGTA